MANSDYDREREINEIGRDKVASNNKKHAMNVKKRKEELAKKVGGKAAFSFSPPRDKYPATENNSALRSRKEN